MPARRLTGALLIALAALAVAGCGTRTLDDERAERAIAQGIEEQTNAEDVTVECPDDVEIQAGNKFECDVTAGEEEAKVEVTQADDEGNVNWRLVQ